MSPGYDRGEARGRLVWEYPRVLHDSGPSRVIPLGDGGSASFVRILAGEMVAAHPGGRPAWCRVLRGRGRTRAGAFATTWRAGDAFALPPGETAAHAAFEDAALAWVLESSPGAAPRPPRRLRAGEASEPRRLHGGGLVLPLEAPLGCWTWVGRSANDRGGIAEPERLAWEPESAFAIPAGCWFQHRNESDADAWFLTLNDGPGAEREGGT